MNDKAIIKQMKAELKGVVMKDGELIKKMNEGYQTPLFSCRRDLTMFYAIGIMSKMMKKGLMSTPFDISDDGDMIYTKLIKLGFKPTEDEIVFAMVQIFTSTQYNYTNAEE